jgi:hypothetical protein
MPLELAFAWTGHRFQGLSAGKVDPGKIPNSVEVIVVDPDVPAAESMATGFLYTITSRATGFGDPDGLNSAIYFTGPHLTKERIQDLLYKKNTRSRYANVERRDKWVRHLERNIIPASSVTKEQIAITFAWTKQTFPYETLRRRTQEYIKAKA